MLLTLTQAAKRAGVSRRMIFRKMAEGVLIPDDSSTPSTGNLFDVRHIDGWIAKRRGGRLKYSRRCADVPVVTGEK